MCVHTGLKLFHRQLTQLLLSQKHCKEPLDSWNTSWIVWAQRREDVCWNLAEVWWCSRTMSPKHERKSTTYDLRKRKSTFWRCPVRVKSFTWSSRGHRNVCEPKFWFWFWRDDRSKIQLRFRLRDTEKLLLNSVNGGLNFTLQWFILSSHLKCECVQKRRTTVLILSTLFIIVT